nr:hypothetical protein [Tanacetum cinerariifolium]
MAASTPKLTVCLSAKKTVWNEFSCSLASVVICLATGRKFNFSKYIFDSMVRNVDSPSKFLMYPRFLQAAEEEEENEMPISPSPPPQDPTPTPHATPPQDQPSTPPASPPQEQPTTTSKSFILEDSKAEAEGKEVGKEKEIKAFRVQEAEKGGNIEAIDVNKDITLVDVETQKEVVTMDAEPQRRIDQEDVNVASKGVNAAVPTLFDDEEREYKKVQTLFKPDKDVEEPKKKRVADKTLLQESFKKLRAAEVLGSRTYWKIIRVGRITEAYQSFEDILKGVNREDMVALWNLVKEKLSSAVPSVDKEKALCVKLKRLFESDADDVLWKLQRYMHYPIIWKLYTNCEVHQVSSTTRRHDMFMLTERDYPLSNAVMILMLSGKLQVEEDNEMARDLVMKIFMEANKPKSRSFDTSSK